MTKTAYKIALGLYLGYATGKYIRAILEGAINGLVESMKKGETDEIRQDDNN